MDILKKGKILGDLEKEIMEIIWKQQNPTSVKQVTEILQTKRKVAYTTILTIMTRLADKGLLKRKILGKAYLYYPASSKDKFLSNTSRQIIKNFFLSFGDAAVAHFSEEIANISPEKRKELLKLLRERK